jgi:activating signal cointegrator complex subunit 1
MTPPYCRGNIRPGLNYYHRQFRFSAQKFQRTMTDTKGTSRRQSQTARKGKRQPLTHFLCLPLINNTSMPQLESSVADFKTAHLHGPDPTSPAFSSDQASSSPLIIPHGAFRPLGTLHLTLGVMSLRSEERLEQAISFFQSLDLKALISEADRVATRTRNTHTSSVSLFPTHAPDQKGPLIVSLESLNALPNAKSASALYASPVDHTGRLYPFCVMLRDKFIEAGFIENEASKAHTGDNAVHEVSKYDSKVANRDEPLLNSQTSPRAEQKFSSKSSKSPADVDPYGAALFRQAKLRPLLLHATLVNTTYVRGRQNAKSNGADGKKTSNRITFDARNLVSQYKSYYTDETLTNKRPVTLKTEDHPEPSSSVADGNSKQPKTQARNHHLADSRQSNPTYPFVWAKNIALDSVCICEMGAKKISLCPSDSGNNALNIRLGEKYTVVSERSLGDK